MRLTILRDDGFVSVDGEGLTGIDLSSIDVSINAIQWYDTYGEIEVKDDRNRIINNIEIDNIDDYMYVVDLWNQKKLEKIENENRLKAELSIE